uniref:5-aminolevulinate synthase n=1 Tax=Hematodinium sp. SG-2015 TaxID=1649283 RepID=A0A0F7C9L8_9DINO|nr:ALAS [Hematodinium sp. SG-2015]|eukprot:GEMP01007185.1.p1 GENE.GEMP01007185.1~~GEMP01007185.1.p1  ORF type:complete len:540 (+),score=92.05 GEMP01007185.1:201-1820(+)
MAGPTSRVGAECLKIKMSDIPKMCPFMKRFAEQNGGIQNVAVEKIATLSNQCPVVKNSSITLDAEGPVTREDDNKTFPQMSKSKCPFSQHMEQQFKQFQDKFGTPVSPKACMVRHAHEVTYGRKFMENIKKLQDEGRYRSFANLQRQVGNFPNASFRPPAELQDVMAPDGEPIPVRIFCSNDYLGMGQNPKVLEASHNALKTSGSGAGGTRNISGTTVFHVDLETELAQLHQKEKSLVCSSGFVANEAALSVVGQLLPGCIIYSDEDNHASMIAGIRHSKCTKKIFKHNNMEDLERLLKEAPFSTPKMIVFESVYSMTGKIAPMADIVYLSRRYNALTFVDEVHAVGMYGEHGAGVAERDGVMHEIDIISGTLGKAFGVFGGYVAASQNFIDCVRSFASGFIFTTAIPPVVAAGALASVRHLRWSQEERTVQHLRAKQLKEMAIAAGLPYLVNPSHIVPMFVGDATKCKELTDRLLYKHRIYLQPINFPTVPVGTERIRITPGPLHSEKDLENLIDALKIEWELLNLPRLGDIPAAMAA